MTWIAADVRRSAEASKMAIHASEDFEPFLWKALEDVAAAVAAAAASAAAAATAALGCGCASSSLREDAGTDRTLATARPAAHRTPRSRRTQAGGCKLQAAQDFMLDLATLAERHEIGKIYWT